MTELRYITRGNSSPVGKPKIYFCAHDGDFDLYLQSIASELTKMCDCAVFYRTAGRSIRDEEHLNDLLRMQMFVVPITTRLLSEKSDALTYEVKLARENGIPILPIMQERGLNEFFEKVFGQIQYLDRNEDDGTGIGYDAKLAKHLSSVLVGEELAERVRKAFDAYVFLSYRKKDRRHAEELMRLVHKDEELRDIAIWYDEFLTPGEDFNDMIKAALIKSDMFLLAVTPNVVNEDNYIMRIEYPMAVEAKKTVLPAEMVKTDRNVLKEKYKNIPPSVEAHDGMQLKGSLLSSLRNIATRSNDSPEHNYFIGLAYLAGIDVEIDHSRALKLITSSADAGLIEAVDRLVSMYKEGNGAPRSYDKALEYQNKKITLISAGNNAALNAEDAEKLACAYLDAGNLCCEMYRFDDAKRFFSEGAAFVLDSKYRNKLLRYRAVCLDKLGNVHKSLGDIKTARAVYEDAAELKKQILSHSDTPDAKRDLAIAYERLADIEFSEGDANKALDLYGKSYALNRELCGTKIDPEARRGVAISLEKIADAKLKQGIRFNLTYDYERVCEIRKALVEELKNEQSSQYLAISYDKLGDLAIYDNSVKEALEYYLKANEIRENLVKEYGTVTAQRYLAVSYTRLGAVYGTLAPSLSSDYFDRAMKIRRALLDKYNTVEQKRDLSLSYEWLGNSYMQNEEFSLALSAFSDAKKLRFELVKGTDTATSLRDFASICSSLGYAYVRLGDCAAARREFSEQLTYMERLCENYKGADVKYELAIAYEDAALGFEMIQCYAEAKEYCIKAFDIFRELNRQGSVDTVIARREKIADISSLMGDIVEELQQRRQVVEMREMLLTKSNDFSNADLNRNLAAAVEKYAAALLKAGYTEHAKEKYDYVLSIKSINDRDNMADTYESLSLVCDAMGDRAGAKKYQDAANNARRVSEQEYEFSMSRVSYSDMYFDDDEDGPSYEDVDCASISSALGAFDRVGTLNRVTLSKDKGAKQYASWLARDFSAAGEHEMQGDVYKKAGKPNKAAKCYERAIEAHNFLKSSGKVSDVRRPIYILKEKLGDVAISSGKNREALRLYSESVKDREDLAKTDSSKRMTEELAVGYGCLGDAYRALSDHEKAAHYFELELAQNLKLKKMGAAPKQLRSLRYNYDNLGVEYAALGNRKGEYEGYKNAALLYLEITEEGKRDSKYLLDRYEKIGDACMSFGKYAEAREYYERSLKLRQNLCLTNETEENKRLLAIGYGCLGDALAGEGKHTEAKAAFKEELALRLYLCALKKSDEYLIDVAYAHINLSVANLGLGDYKEARDDAKQAIAITKRLANKNSKAKNYLRKSYRQMAAVMSTLSKNKAADSFMKKAEKV